MEIAQNISQSPAELTLVVRKARLDTPPQSGLDGFLSVLNTLFNQSSTIPDVSRQKNWFPSEPRAFSNEQLGEASCAKEMPLGVSNSLAPVSAMREGLRGKPRVANSTLPVENPFAPVAFAREFFQGRPSPLALPLGREQRMSMPLLRQLLTDPDPSLPEGAPPSGQQFSFFFPRSGLGARQRPGTGRALREPIPALPVENGPAVTSEPDSMNANIAVGQTGHPSSACQTLFFQGLKSPGFAEQAPFLSDVRRGIDTSVCSLRRPEPAQNPARSRWESSRPACAEASVDPNDTRPGGWPLEEKKSGTEGDLAFAIRISPRMQTEDATIEPAEAALDAALKMPEGPTAGIALALGASNLGSNSSPIQPAPMDMRHGPPGPDPISSANSLAYGNLAAPKLMEAPFDAAVGTDALIAASRNIQHASRSDVGLKLRSQDEPGNITLFPVASHIGEIAALDGPGLGAGPSTSRQMHPGNDLASSQPNSNGRSRLGEVVASEPEGGPIYDGAAQVEATQWLRGHEAGPQLRPVGPRETKAASEGPPLEAGEPNLKQDNSERVEGKKWRAAPCDSDVSSGNNSRPRPDLGEIWRLAPQNQQTGNTAAALGRPAVSTIPPVRDAGEKAIEQNIPSQARQVSLRLVGSDANSVSVLLTEKAGKVQIAVRTPDHELSKTLQGNLGDLVGRLEAKGFKAETCVSSGAQSNSAARQETSNFEQGRGGSSSSWSGAQQQNRQGNGSGHRRRPHWLAQLDETLSTEDIRGKGK